MSENIENTDGSESLNKETFSFVKEVLSLPENESFKKKILDFKEKMEQRGYLPYKKTKAELLQLQEETSVPLDDDGDLNEYCHLLDRIQANKDRCVAILVQAQADHIFTEKYFDSLSKMWLRYSDAKSQDRREAESADLLHFSIGARSRSHELFEIARVINFNFQQKYEIIKEKIRVRIQEHRSVNEEHGVYASAFTPSKKREREKEKERRIQNDKVENSSTEKGSFTSDWEDL